MHFAFVTKPGIVRVGILLKSASSVSIDVCHERLICAKKLIQCQNDPSTCHLCILVMVCLLAV